MSLDLQAAISRNVPTDVVVRLGDQEWPAHSLILRMLSSCARGLPDGFQEWNLSELLIDGQPTDPETVSAWLELVYHGIVPQLSRFAGGGHDLEDIVELLRFADAVGSEEHLMMLALNWAPHLRLLFEVAGPGTLQVELNLMLDGSRRYGTRSSHLHGFYIHEEKVETRDIRCIYNADMRESLPAARQAIAEAVEKLLYLSLRIQLSPFTRRILAFVQNGFQPLSTEGFQPLLEDCLHLVLTTRVMKGLGLDRLPAVAEMFACGLLSKTTEGMHQALARHGWGKTGR